jgi:hypothetical protein
MAFIVSDSKVNHSVLPALPTIRLLESFGPAFREKSPQFLVEKQGPWVLLQIGDDGLPIRRR